MLTDEFFHAMDGSWSSAGCIEYTALCFGLDPRGSMHSPTTTLDTMGIRKRLLELITTKMRERPDLPCERLSILPAPQSTPGCTFGTHETLSPADYMGLGVRDRKFSFEVLREHCTLVPYAASRAVTIVLQDTTRHLKCQRLFCNHDILLDTQWTLCKYCMLAVYCEQCISSDIPCRFCLNYASIDTLPNRWLFDRRNSIAKFNDKYRFEERDAFVTVIYTEAVPALCEAVRVSSSNSACCRLTSDSK